MSFHVPLLTSKISGPQRPVELLNHLIDLYERSVTDFATKEAEQYSCLIFTIGLLASLTALMIWAGQM